jgi:hypothetical protein
MDAPRRKDKDTTNQNRWGKRKRRGKGSLPRLLHLSSLVERIANRKVIRIQTGTERNGTERNGSKVTTEDQRTINRRVKNGTGDCRIGRNKERWSGSGSYSLSFNLFLALCFFSFLYCYARPNKIKDNSTS